ncbi:cytochrome c oxidase assembly protein-like protein cox15 [Calycina marina]|uniref:Cytochrome c oxidase assembly protein-like protein cox15 n=1 Tax=Calycina marina TaxID=1763456 RepID=A0A9P7Z841_9HELO|nr:cytochrome c oxidase assembly protein-like protein cox15 [Calycina marina]
MTSIFTGIRWAAPRLSPELLICHQCLMKAPTARISASRAQSLRNIRFNSTANATQQAAFAQAKTVADRSISNAKSEFSAGTEEISKGKAKFFPKHSSKSVAYWLFASAGSVFGIVVFGGLTRLTESGLSITEWKPVTGSLPPLSAEDWQSEFDKYRASPEFKQLNSGMDMDDFKKIYFMEWTHRLWGRVIGLSFVLPAIYFVARRKVSAKMSMRLLGISGLIGFQGAIGWWMVKSGLKDDLFAPGAHPRVSQYRLTTHLGAAFICYTAMLWNGLHILRMQKFVKDAVTTANLARPELSVFRKSVAGLALLVFITAMSGGLVAGLDAGMIYNKFWYMGEGLTPPKSELFSKFYSRKEDGSDIWWRNMMENPSTVQLDHRILAMTTLTTILSLWAYTRLNKSVKLTMPVAARKGMLGVVHLVLLQVTLGISTLVYLVPTPLAAAHQAGSLALLTGVIVLGSRIWVPKKTLMALQKTLGTTASQTASKRVGLANAACVQPVLKF